MDTQEAREARAREWAEQCYDEAFHSFDRGEYELDPVEGPKELHEILDEVLWSWADNCMDTMLEWKWSNESREFSVGSGHFWKLFAEQVLPEWFREAYPEVRHPRTVENEEEERRLREFMGG